MKLNFINNISLTKIAGLKKILTAEIFDNHIKVALFQRKENIFRITSPTFLSNFAVISSGTFDVGVNELSSILKNYLEKLQLKNLYVLIGINECLYQKINVPSDVEDDDLWFLENNERFIPEGRSSDEFLYSYKKIMADDYSRHYFVITARKDYIERITKSCTVSGVHILSILPFFISLLTTEFDDEANYLLLLFLKDKLQYVRKDFENYFDVGEIYYGYDEDGLSDYPGLPANITSSINKMLQLYLQSNKIQSADIILSCPQKINAPLRTFLLNNLSNKSTLIDSKIESHYMHSLLAVSNVFENIDSIFNLISDQLEGEGRNALERQSWLRLTLASGAIILLLLLASNFFSSMVNNEQSGLDEKTSSITLDKQQLQKLKDENKFYKSNLDLLDKLKDKKKNYSFVLWSFNDITNSRTCLTHADIKNYDDTLYINITGLAYTQSDVSGLIGRIESTGQFHNFSLVYSSPYKQNDSNTNSTAVSRNYIQFNLRYEYCGN